MDGLSDGAQFTCAALKMTCRVVMGYGGSNQAALAVSTGEMDAMYVSDTSANNYVQGNQVKPVAAMARKRSRYFPDVKTIFEAVSLDKDQQWLVDFRAEVEDLGRILVTVPNLPPARLAFLQKAVRETLTDPELIAEGERAQRFIDFEDAETTLKRINKTVSEITPEQRARVKEILAQTSK
jgi:tripartite-type tricarboxylate transporter receptor subunit TctC